MLDAKIITHQTSDAMKLTYLLLIAVLIGSNYSLAQNLYTHSNAANIDNEQDSYNGWSGSAEIDSDDENPMSGDYCIRIKSNDDGRDAHYTFNANPGDSYQIIIWARKGQQSSNPLFDGWEGVTGFEKTNITGQGWKEYIFNVTATSANPKIRVLASKNASENKEVLIDAVSILLHNDPPSGGGEGDENAYNPGNSNLPSVDWQAKNMYAAGSMGIGTYPSNNYRLAVNGKIRAKEVIVETGWADFVFDPGYHLPSLKEVKSHIDHFGHLKGIPTTKQVEENGISLGEINTLLLQKIEEMTLYLIKADERIEALENEIESLR